MKNSNLFLDDHVPKVSEGRRFGGGAGNEPLGASGNKNMFTQVLGFHPTAVEDNPAGVEVPYLVACKNIRCQEYVVVVKGN